MRCRCRETGTSNSSSSVVLAGKTLTTATQHGSNYVAVARPASAQHQFVKHLDKGTISPNLVLLFHPC